MKALRELVPKKYLFNFVRLKNFFTHGYKKEYYSQSGEDVIIRQFFKSKNDGFFVDIGAYHPKHYSNTYLLHKKGWRGINIDPNPDNMRIFRSARKNDINVQVGVAKQAEKLTYYKFSHPSCNTFSKEDTLQFKDKKWIESLGEENIQCLPLRDILHTHLPEGQTIDLVNIDVEGFDLEVLESNDWNKFKPQVIIIEDHPFEPGNPTKSDIFNYLTERGYTLHSYTGLSLIFKKN